MVFFRRKKKEDITPLASMDQDLSQTETAKIPENISR